MIGPQHGRLLSPEGELIAEGPCWLDEEAGQATMEPQRTPGVLQKERGRLALELDSGRSYIVSDKAMIFRLGPNGKEPQRQRRKLFRLQIIEKSRQDAGATGAAGQGQPAPDFTGLRSNGETPVAR